MPTSIKFYCEVLGFEIAGADGRRASPNGFRRFRRCRTYRGLGVDFRGRQLDRYTLPRLAVPADLMQQQHSWTWLVRGKERGLEGRVAGSLQFYSSTVLLHVAVAVIPAPALRLAWREAASPVERQTISLGAS
jgi:hypothetical protein